MAAETEIAWTDSTFNPWVGCQKVGPGCDHCYAEAWDARFKGEHWGPRALREKARKTNFAEVLIWINSRMERLGHLHSLSESELTLVLFRNGIYIKW